MSPFLSSNFFCFLFQLESEIQYGSLIRSTLRTNKESWARLKVWRVRHQLNFFLILRMVQDSCNILFWTLIIFRRNRTQFKSRFKCEWDTCWRFLQKSKLTKTYVVGGANSIKKCYYELYRLGERHGMADAKALPLIPRTYISW